MRGGGVGGARGRQGEGGGQVEGMGEKVQGDRGKLGLAAPFGRKTDVGLRGKAQVLRIKQKSP